MSPDRTLELQAGIMRITAKEDEVYLLENVKKTQVNISASSAASLRQMSVSPELDIRGLMTDEVGLIVERYLDSAVMAKLSTVSIIHGKGTGALRAAVHQILKKSRQVKSFRLGRYGEGETGVTIVELR